MKMLAIAGEIEEPFAAPEVFIKLIVIREVSGC